MEEQTTSQNQIRQIVDTAVASLRQAAEVNTIVGQPFVGNDGSTILPVSQVSFAFVAGGGEYGKNKKPDKDKSSSQFAGGSGGGATLSPVGFLVLNNSGAKLIKFDEESTFLKIADAAASILESFKN